MRFLSSVSKRKSTSAPSDTTGPSGNPADDPIQELRRIYFDAHWYGARHPEAVATGDLWGHYLANAHLPGFVPNPLSAPPTPAGTRVKASALFDADWYLHIYPDIFAAGVDPVRHYLEAGRFEGRMPNAYFDPAYYVSRHPDVAIENALGNYVLGGRNEGCDPNPYFASAWYGECYLAEALEINPLQHYLEHGAHNGLWPHPFFDETRYLDLNPDVARLVRAGELASGYMHFVCWGARDIEDRAYLRVAFDWGPVSLEYDRLAYLTDNPDVQAAIEEGRSRSGIEHLFSQGWREAKSGLRAIYGPRHALKLLDTRPPLPNAGEGSASKKRRGRYLCLFAHYDRDDRIDDYVLIYLKALRRFDVDIVFITATATENELAKVAPLVVRTIVKNDAGRDFGSWVLALEVLGLDCGEGYERVVFANDSIYFPVRPIAPLFADMEARAYNLYGMSDSAQMGAYHLQSFFLAFDPRAQAVLFPRFVERFKRFYLLTKWGQIGEFEVGLSKMAQDAGLSIGAFFSSQDVREDVLRDPRLSRWSKMRSGVAHLNPTHDLWDLMIGEYGWPGLKVELLRDNPNAVDGLEGLPDLIADGETPIAVIEAHQARMKRPGVRVRSAQMQVRTPLSLVRRISGGATVGGERLVLFAHHDPQRVVDPHVLHQVEALRRAGCDVVFITATDVDAALAPLLPLVSDILVKTDVGRDFGSWFLALQAMASEVRQARTVVWMNDSTYFPLFDPSRMFAEMKHRGADFWGVVDSYNGGWHVMSWLWVFERAAMETGVFDWYISEFNATYDKWAQIRNYEIRIPAKLKSAGLAVASYVCADDVRSHILSDYPDHPRLATAAAGDFNMAHDFWREIITDFSAPALKVELVRDNPLGIDLSRLMSVIDEFTDYDPDLIRRHMSRLKASHLPLSE